MMGGGARAALGLVCITLIGVSRLPICIIRATRIAVYASPWSRSVMHAHLHLPGRGVPHFPRLVYRANAYFRRPTCTVPASPYLI